MNSGWAITGSTPAVFSRTTTPTSRLKLKFSGIPYTQGDNNGGLPQLTFNDASTWEAPPTCLRLEPQNTYTLSDTFTLITGNKTWKFGGEIRPEENTIYETEATLEVSMGFTTQFTDNAGDRWYWPGDCLPVSPIAETLEA